MLIASRHVLLIPSVPCYFLEDYHLSSFHFLEFPLISPDLVVLAVRRKRLRRKSWVSSAGPSHSSSICRSAHPPLVRCLAGFFSIGYLLPWLRPPQPLIPPQQFGSNLKIFFFSLLSLRPSPSFLPLLFILAFPPYLMVVSSLF